MKIILVLSCVMCISATLFPPLLNKLLAMKLKGLLGGDFGEDHGDGKKQTNGDVVYSNVCVYSNDPNKFEPKCFLCPDEAYPNILDACNPEVSIASSSPELDFDQASCVEANCKIEIPSKNHPIRTGRDTSGSLIQDHKSETGLYSGPITISDIQSLQRPERARSEVQHIQDNRIYDGKVGGIMAINGTDYFISRQIILKAVGKI